MNQRRVLFVTSNYPRWAADTTTPFVHHLAVDLTARDWDVTVLAPHAPGAARHERLDGVQVKRFRYLLPERAQTVGYGGGAMVNLRGSRSAKAKVPALVAAEWFATAAALVRGCDLVHAHWALPQGFVAATTPRRRIPRVLTVHGGDVFGLRGKVLDRFNGYALRAADRVTVNSSATEAAAREIGGERVKLARVPMGVDLDVVLDRRAVEQIRAQYRRPDGPLLVFVGRVVEEKGVEDVVRTVALLADTHPDVSAVIAGTGQHAQRVRELARELGVAERIALPGWVEPDQVPNWFAAADVVLAPSKVSPDGWIEGQGLAIVEAMAVGAAVVSTRTGGIPDTITDGETGVLVAPDAPDELAAAVARLLADPDQVRRLGDAAQQSVRARFDREVTADRFAAIYAELLAARRNR